MGPSNDDRALIQTVLRKYERLYNLNRTPGIECYTAFDPERDHYMLVEWGWTDKRRVRETIIYVRIRDGKFWIEEDMTERGVATDLEEAGVPKDRIVLAFCHPWMRPETDYAVA